MPSTCDNGLMPKKQQILSTDELADLDILCDLANKPSNKQLQLTDETNDSPNRPPLRLQNLALPMRVRACRVLLAVANGAHYKQALADQGLSHLQFTAIRHKDHDFALVFEAAKRASLALTAANAKTGLDRLVTEDGCGLNAKAVMFAAERLDPERFGKAADEQDGGGRSGAKTVYNIVINAGSGARPCGNLAETDASTPAIDVESHE